MIRRRLLLPLLLAVSCAALPAQVGELLPNLTDVKEQLLNYHDSGSYDREIVAVVEEAKRYLEHCSINPAEKPAVVFDIDETALSNWERMRQYDFYVNGKILAETDAAAIATPIIPSRELFRLAQSKHVATIFLTGRKENLRAATERNLANAGYDGYTRLILRTDTDDRPAVRYKSEVRKRLVEEEHFHILLTIGDQRSDLDGGYADRAFKLPNPFYKLP